MDSPEQPRHNADLFPLTIIPLHLQERIITKLQPVSYFRIQQSCKFICQMVKDSRDISVYMEGEFRMYCERKEPVDRHLHFTTDYGREFSGIYGIRFEKLDLLYHANKSISNGIVDVLKKHRITARAVEDHNVDKIITIEQSAELYRTLKPKSLFINDKYRSKAVFGLKNLMELRLHIVLKPNEAKQFVENFLPLAKDLYIFAITNELPKVELWTLLESTMKWLKNKTFPDLEHFSICFEDMENRTPNVDQLLKMYKEYEPTVVVTQKMFAILNCTLDDGQSTCKLICDKAVVKIEYHQTA